MVSRFLPGQKKESSQPECFPLAWSLGFHLLVALSCLLYLKKFCCCRSVVDLRCYVSFRCTTKWSVDFLIVAQLSSRTCILFHSFPSFLAAKHVPHPEFSHCPPSSALVHSYTPNVLHLFSFDVWHSWNILIKTVCRSQGSQKKLCSLFWHVWGIMRACACLEWERLARNAALSLRWGNDLGNSLGRNKDKQGNIPVYGS